MIETFEGDWEKEWFTYKPEDWARRTHKIYDDKWKAPVSGKLSIEVRAEQSNKLVVGIDKYALEILLTGDSKWHRIVLSPGDFHDGASVVMADWNGIKELRLGAQEILRGKIDGKGRILRLGAIWKGKKPEFRNLRWIAQ